VSVLANLSRALVRNASPALQQGGPPVPLSRRSEVINVLTNHNGNTTNQVEQYKRNSTLYSAAGFNATAVAAAVWHLYQSADGRGRVAGTDTRREVFNHQALRLWNRPNQFMTGAFFQEFFQLHLELTGLVYWVIVRNGAGIPISMWPIGRDSIVPVPDPEDYLRGYVYIGPQGEKIPLQLDEVIALQLVDPTDTLGGVAPTQPLMTDLESARMTSEFRRNFFKNSANPGGIIELDSDANLTDDEFEELSERWAEQHRGVRNAHRVAILERGKWVSNDQSLKDMQFVEMRQDDRDTVYEAYRTSKSLIGVTEDVNRANAEANEYVYAKWNLATKLSRIRDALNFFFLPMFSTASNGEYAFDYDDVVPADWQAEAATLTAQSNAVLRLIQAGFDPAEAATAVGLPVMKYIGPPALLTLPRPGMLPPGSFPEGDEPEQDLPGGGA
jgi:HK97 family phage portal protein